MTLILGGRKPKPFTGRHMLAIMISFFATVIAVNVFLAVMAIRTNSGLVVEDSYKAGVTYNSDMAKAKANAAMDVHPSLSFNHGQLRVALARSDGTPVDVKLLSLTFGHPVSASTDQAMAFAPQSTGIFVAQAALSSGLWAGDLRATLANGNTWMQPIKLVVK